jgi:hypothetical protein
MNVFQDVRMVALMVSAKDQKFVYAMKDMPRITTQIPLYACQSVTKNVSMVNVHSLTIVHALLGTKRIWKTPRNVYPCTMKNVQMVGSLCMANVYAMKDTQKMNIQMSVFHIVLLNVLMATALLQTNVLAMMVTQMT